MCDLTHYLSSRALPDRPQTELLPSRQSFDERQSHDWIVPEARGGDWGVSMIGACTARINLQIALTTSAQRTPESSASSDARRPENRHEIRNRIDLGTRDQIASPAGVV